MGQQHQSYYSKRHLCWDEENRLVSFADCENAGFYQYDANGERTYKLTGGIAMQNIQGHWRSYNLLDNPTLYTSPYLVATPKGYTKHYYAESERVASMIGSGGLGDITRTIGNMEDFLTGSWVGEDGLRWEEDRIPDFYEAKQEESRNHLTDVMMCAGADPIVEDNRLVELRTYWQYIQDEGEHECYWYHPDHLGSSSWITEKSGYSAQHLHYLPWGENFVDQRSTTWNAMYTFSAKEKDAETGYSYFGSRYYNSDLSIWLSVDPMASKYPHQSNYVYCSNNPIKIIDPNGEDEWELYPDGKVRWKRQSEEHTLYAVNTKGERTGNSLTLKNRQIFDDLATSGESSDYSNSHSVGGENMQDDMLNVFKFAADNSTVEWRVDRFRDNGNSSYAVGTVHKTNYAPTAEELGHSSSSVIAFIHSHPKANLSGELWSMGFRSQVNGIMRFSKESDIYLKTYEAGYMQCLYYTYFPKSGNLFCVRGGKKPAYIRNITNYRQFMFGTINTR